jgi:alkanesulfonate monooxygenase SsuD/methylene tetrahydromethanopterin reductase-like flavin-dependent oxidoreductase (luciferase family)
MKVGLHLHPDRGIDAVFEESRLADEQGFDSMWLSDHLMGWVGRPSPDSPMDAFTLMVALGARTRNIRLAWSMLNVSPHNPAVLAKMVATADRVTKGRVIATVGSGWFREELAAYNVPLIQDHDARSAYAREVVELWRQLWLHPAPEVTTFEGQFVQVHDVPFSPAPHQKPMPPIWMGGDSPPTMAIIRDLADGWVPWSAVTKADFERVLSAPDWPDRPITVSRGTRIFVAEKREMALQEARDSFDTLVQARARRVDPPNFPSRHWPESFDEFLDQEIVGDPDDCLTQLAEYESWGVTHVRVTFDTPDHQDRAARLILPRLWELEVARAAESESRAAPHGLT